MCGSSGKRLPHGLAMQHDAAQSLWHRVLVQAIRDAVATPDVARKNDRLAVSSAQHWMEGHSADFATVCLLAGRDPDKIREWWRTIKNDDDKIKAVRLSMRDTTHDTSGKRIR